MKNNIIILILLLIISASMLISVPVGAEPVRCDQCTEEYPCSTVFMFRDVKFVHSVYCEIVDGKEVWGSADEEVIEMFYYDDPRNSKNKEQVEI